MSVYNTSADAANTAVRAFLTQLGEYYLGRNFNTGSGKAKADWERIRDIVFGGECAYCGKSGVKLQMDHLIMFNRSDFGLHHPGNVVPACTQCNSRSRNPDKSYNSWEEHLSFICESNNEKDKFYNRWRRIKDHVNSGDFKYPTLTGEEEKAIRIIANNLYESIKNAFDNATNLYEQLDEAFSKASQKKNNG